MPLAICGRTEHGRVSTCGGPPVCFACYRPGCSDGPRGFWKHVGAGPFWSTIAQWSAEVGEAWVHSRDLRRNPLEVGECLCTRVDCVFNMYSTYRHRSAKNEKGSWDTMVKGQSSRMGRYPSTRAQV
ncbi:unnamed protein product, partial [Ectocarpus fasciculatus]